jgi:hypothetical protein
MVLWPAPYRLPLRPRTALPDRRLGSSPVAGVSHYPIRRTWRCTGCDRDWPCDTRRQQLVREYADAPTSLTLLMAAAFVEASADLAELTAGDLYHRFLSWIR